VSRSLDRSTRSLDCEVARKPAAVALGRRAVAAWLDEVGVDPDRGRDVVTVASELLALGVLYGAGSSMSVSAANYVCDVYVEVATLDQPSADDRHDGLVDPDWALRTLCIVRRLVDGMSVGGRGDESLVCCRFDLSRPSQVGP
jgi:anti-sigma regulatory factor (Ser/Thr protein kinase)